MNQLSSIKERLKNFNDTEFQELCDSFLNLRHRGYKAYARNGAHDIKQKTTRGTPDSFFLMPNGLYLFVESTTTENKGKRLLDKLKNDISACLNKDKTGIAINKIQDIILCYNSNLSSSQMEEINKEAEKAMGKPPVHFSLDSLATEIFFHHKNLAHDYLGLPLDTGQIVLLEKFVEEYDNGKQKLATPLSGAFLHRTKELKEIKEKLNSEDIVIISGAAGVGKSKLALQAIKKFLELHLDYNAYAISPKGADFLGDLSTYFEGDENSILLVDDVNRVDKFEQILGFYGSLKKEKLKIVLTVRDYALENVREWLSRYESAIIKIKRFDSDEIKAIIELKPFEIYNGKYQHKIYTIAKGNARLAVMMAIIAKKTNKLDSLNNVSDLFEQYFETFVGDKQVFKNKKVLKVMGVLSFFYAIPYNDGTLLGSVSNSFSISSDELRESFDLLHNLDLIELNYEHAKIGEQNLSTYFFYKVFLKDKLLSFESLWNNYFELQPHRFKDTLYPTHQNFGKQFITEQVKPTLLAYWAEISKNEKKAFQFLNFAWEFVPDECLAYLDSKISAIQHSEIIEFKVTYEHNDYSGTKKREPHLELISHFFEEHNYFLDAVDLAFKFVECIQQHLPQLIYHINEGFHFMDEDYSNHFNRQLSLINYLANEVENSKLRALSFLAISKELMGRTHWTYENSEDIEEDDKNIIIVKQIRSIILKTSCKLYTSYPKEVFEVIFDFSIHTLSYNEYTLAFDLKYLIPWINKHLKTNNFHHCYYVQEIIRYSIKEGVDHTDFKRLKSSFIHAAYRLFELVNWDRHQFKDRHDFNDDGEFEELKEADIIKTLIFKSNNDIETFITNYSEILRWNKLRLYSQDSIIGIITNANLDKNTDIGFAIFVEFVKLQDKGILNSKGFIPHDSLEKLNSISGLAERFWKTIESENLKEIWKLEILTSLSEERILKRDLTRLITTLNEIKVNFWLQSKRLEQYKSLEPNILIKIIGIVVQKIEQENLKIKFDENFIILTIDSIENIDLLKKAYLQQAHLSDHFDYQGKALLEILKRDNSFLLDLVRKIYKDNNKRKLGHHRGLSMVWELSNPVEVLDEPLRYVANNENNYHYISRNFMNVFFKSVKSQEKKANNCLIYFIRKYSHESKIINIVFDVIHTSRNHLFEKALATYLQRNQDVNCFKKINWTERQVVYSGDVIVGSVRAAKWERLLNMIESTKLGIKTRQIKAYIKSRIDSELQYAEHEKRRKFIGNF
ncbi:hypothetical protein ATO12_12630 [Aquimarina atlantica]|uniref:Novel STAND NTPase 3 domain-containing protein n=1 Tax=Aquimarina atlantica TaxID=1317122 RepID=A0A023BX75_9FLAO|nr:hypothetical protein [Aquimarina atlantica]EZH74605.1 hypothetical protein ATO12_12630 [Aquimarina atlantica]